MSKEVTLKVGDVIKNEVGQFTKVISINDGRYGLSGWTTLTNAKKATMVTTFLNEFAIETLAFDIIDAESDDELHTSDDQDTDEVSKEALAKLSAKEVKAKAVELGLNADGTKAETLELLYTHFEL